jgi:hypothetical protein
MTSRQGETFFSAASGPPYSNRLSFQDPPGRFDDPYAHLGGDPSRSRRDANGVPAVRRVAGHRSFAELARVQQWNLTVERQIGSNYAASVSYLGSYY